MENEEVAHVELENGPGRVGSSSFVNRGWACTIAAEALDR
jgi:hypothetical protein